MKKLILSLLIGAFIMTGLSAKTAFVYFSFIQNIGQPHRHGVLYFYLQNGPSLRKERTAAQ